MYDLISIGTLTIDLYFKGDSLTSEKGRFELAMGGKYFTDNFHESLGGGGANVAIGVQRHGLRTALKSTIGNNAFKKMIVDKLHEEQVSHLYCHCVENYLNISTILLAESGEKTVINYQTHHQHLFNNEEELSILLRAKHIFLGNLPDVSLQEKNNILHFAKTNHIVTFMNLGIVDCRRSMEQLEHMLRHTDVLTVNGYEFAELIKKNYQDIHFKSLLSDGIPHQLEVLKEKLLLVTDGENGSYAYWKNNIYYQEAIKPHHIVDSTGAGDGYTAGFIAEYIQSADIRKSMKVGAEYAAKILGRVGAN